MLKIKLLKALNGDSIIISYGEEKTYNILIDGGCGKLCYRQLCRYIEDMKKEKDIFDLVVLTHIDSDHIEGILRLFSQKDFDFSIIKEMWFNFGEGLQDSLKIKGIDKGIDLYDFDADAFSGADAVGLPGAGLDEADGSFVGHHSARGIFYVSGVYYVPFFYGNSG